MFRLVFSFPIILTSAALAFSEIPDTSGNALSLDSISHLDDSRVANLIKLKMEEEDHSIYAISDTLDGGKGFGLAFQLSDSIFGMEMNNPFKALRSNSPNYL